MDDAVAEVIVKLVGNPKFAAMMQEKINCKVDTVTIDGELADFEKQLRQYYAVKLKLAEEIDSLDPDDRHYIKRKADLDDRLYRMYDKIENVETQLIETRAKKQAIEAEKLTGDNIYKVLIYFEKLYAVMNEIERRQFMETLISEIQIYEDRQPNGQWLKSIKFRLPIIEEDMDFCLEDDKHVETIVCLSHKSPDSVINVKVEFGEGEGKVPLDTIAERAKKYQPKPKITYKMIQEYVKKKYGFKVHTAYIAEVKRSLGLTMYGAPNAVEELKHPRKRSPKEKIEAITDALRYFEVI